MNKNIVTAGVSSAVISVFLPFILMVFFGDFDGSFAERFSGVLNSIVNDFAGYFKYIFFLMLVLFPVSVMFFLLRAKPS